MCTVCDLVRVTILLLMLLFVYLPIFVLTPFVLHIMAHKLFSSVVLKSQEYVLLVTGGIFVHGGSDY